MIARKRYAAGLGGVLGAVLAIGCASAGGPGDKRPAEGSPVSRLPTWDSAEVVDVAEPEILPQTHFSAGRLHETHGRWVRAAEQYRLATGLKADYVEAHNRLGIVLDQLRRFEDADEAFARAIKLAPDQAHLHNNLGFSYMMQLRWQDAEAEFLRALELHPGFARARVNLALALAQRDQFDEALVQFKLALSPADAYFNLGLMYQSKRRLADAARAFKTALELDPKMAAARKRLEQLPADVVSSAEAYAAMEASPAPADTRAEGVSEKSARPSTQPAGGDLPGATATRPADASVPACLRLSIETSMEAYECGSDMPWWLMLDPSWHPDEMFGPPLPEGHFTAYAGSPPEPWADVPEETFPDADEPAVSPAP